MSRLGFGVAAALGPAVAAEVTSQVERLGFATLWTNDVPGADGLVVARAALDATRTIDVGVGVIACDRRPAEMVAADIERLRLPLERCIVGIGAGRSSRPLAEVRVCVATLRQRLGPGARIAVAALGPRMCRLAGELADVVLLNWMTPERIRWARGRIAEGARRVGRDPAIVTVAAYVRVAVGPDAHERLGSDASRYALIPAYGRSFVAMGVDPATVGIAARDPSEVGAALAPYRDVLDETVIRALPSSNEADRVLEIARGGLSR